MRSTGVGQPDPDVDRLGQAAGRERQLVRLDAGRRPASRIRANSPSSSPRYAAQVR